MKMTLKNYLKDHLKLIFTWLILIILVIFYLWLLPLNPLTLSSAAYLFMLSGIVALGYFVLDYHSKKKWWEQLEKEQEQFLDNLNLIQPETEEQVLYINYFSQLHQSYFLLLNKAQIQEQEHKNYIDSWMHEIKVPVASLHLLADNIEDDIDEKRYIQLKQNIKRIDDYIEQVMYYSRLDSFSRDYFIASHSLTQLVNRSVKHSSDMFIYKNIGFALEGEDELVLTDDKWLVFVLNQLMNNALKYTNPQGRITVVIEKNEAGVFLNLSDTGIGIESDEISRVFDKGFTGKNGRNIEVNSTGLGLYLAKQLTEKLGHQITVSSALNKGTTFTIFFPFLSYYTDTNEAPIEPKF